MTILVTGGAGFIGSNFVRVWAAAHDEPVINVDALTYAGNPHNLSDLSADIHQLVQVDIMETEAITKLLRTHKPRAVVHFAAESHVDRSIIAAEAFVQTNMVGTYRLLEACRGYWETDLAADAEAFRFIHVSTDEVFGSLEPHEPAFTETSEYKPNSPYAASKAGSDHMARAFYSTYAMPVIVTNCSNNYGPYQFPEKLIPLMILNALKGDPLPVYGDGSNVRDWLYVTDHCDAIARVLERGRPGETYNIGGNCELPNNEVVTRICDSLDRQRPLAEVTERRALIKYVTDRKGHDQRYAVDCSKIEAELDWSPTESFESGLEKTIAWYLDNEVWVEHVTSGRYRDWLAVNYGERATS